MSTGFYYNEGTGRSYLRATRIDCGTLDAANVLANTVSSASLGGAAQNAIEQTVVDYTANTTTSNALYIVNKPLLSSVATSGLYSSLTGTPSLANVATSGAYSSLTGTPSLSNVALTGAYSSLSGRPANLSSFNNDLTAFSNNVSVTGNVTVSKALAVAGTVSANLISLPNANFTGQYSELKNTPNAAYSASSNVGTLVASSIAANTLTLSANVDYPVNVIENYSGGVNGYSHAITALNPAQSTGEAFMLQVGQTANTYGTAYFGHVYQGAANSTNYATVGLFGQDRIVNVTGNRQVGFNTTTPAYTVDVAGVTRIQSNLLVNSSDNTCVIADAGNNSRLGFVKQSGQSPKIVAASGNPILFGISNQSDLSANISSGTVTEGFRLHSNGYVGINTAAPNSTLSVTGNLSVSTIADYPVNILQNYSSGTNGYSHALSALNPAQSTGEAFMLQVGQTAGTYGTAYFGHVYQGATNSTNYATVGLYGQDRILNVTGNRQVGVNTTTPAYTVDVAGTGRFSNSTTGLRIQSGDPGLLVYSASGTAQATSRASIGLGTSDGGTTPIWVMGQNLNNSGADWFLYNYPSNKTPIYIPSTCSTITFNAPTINPSGAFATRYTMTGDATVAAGGSGITITSWTPNSNVGTSGVPLSLNNGVFATTAAGIYAIQLHLRFNASAGENAASILSTGGSAFSSGTRLAVNDSTVYDVCTNFTGYLASGDGWNVSAYSTVSNSVLASFSNIPSFIQITCLMRCS